MDIRIIARSAHSRAAHRRLAEHASRWLRLRLGQRSDRVAHVSVSLGEGGQLRRARDTFCVMQIQLRDLPSATVVDIGADAYVTIERAAARIGQLVDAMLSGAQARRPLVAGATGMAA